ncbi:MAG: hypothetical protein OEY01_12615 [Desulfobulbaceae bacterium]|nr:hypothetical protein [Desulfobulbaceae bacterium]HIJ79600.1 hypothetical protein [Deltaproteobacteria bacterium]
MLKIELSEKNPIRLLKSDAQGKTDALRMGLVMARAGLGKTAILVQIALDSLLNDKQVIHVSIGQSLDKTKLWYDDMFKDIAKACNLENVNETYMEIMRNRMIMTFNESDFSRARLEERLTDLIQQNVIKPSCIVVDGFDFAGADHQMLADLREMMESLGVQGWFSATCHRDDERVSKAGVPAPCHEVDDLFDIIVLLKPISGKECLSLNLLKAASGVSGKQLQLDPGSLMVRENC